MTVFTGACAMCIEEWLYVVVMGGRGERWYVFM